METISADRCCEAFARIAELATALGVSKIGQLPGCWEHQVDERWWIAVNGGKEARANSDGFEVPSFSAVVKFNGWPAGVIDPYAGVLAAGAAANEDTFIAALQAATALAKSAAAAKERTV